ncbi:MAG TPA: dTMP kinase [Hyphomicrobiaceae bacterium]|nr:dTMP kinase [Hyphomicrobiaceae bacterium]
MRSGKFITLEGGEGVGKSTQATLLVERLAKRGIDVILTREPGGSPFAERIRALLLDPGTPAHGALAEALLFYAARADHLQQKIAPQLDAGGWVVCDRFSDSTRVYQGSAGGVAPEVLERLEDLVVKSHRPDLTVLLDLDPRDGLGRVRRRGAPTRTSSETDRFEQRELEFHERLRAGYLALARAEPQRCVIIDAAEPPEIIAAAVWRAVAERLLAGAG